MPISRDAVRCSLTPGPALGEWDPGLSGQSDAMKRLRMQIRRIAPHFRTVLIRGETGTGKELAARALHRLSGGGPFVSAGCDDFETTRPGTAERTIQAAAGGTLFLKDVHRLQASAQERFLRSLGRQEFGLKMIASTVDDLKVLAAAGRMRSEIHRHFSTVEIVVPTLRERIEDLPELVDGMLRRIAPSRGIGVSASAMKALEAHAWTGNLRELEEVLRQSLAKASRDVIEVWDLPEMAATHDAASSALDGESLLLQDVVERHMLHVLRTCGGNKLRAAETLGISRSTLYRMLEACGESPRTA